MSNIVAIVGRPNVGKSTLFNRLAGERLAIMDDTSGVTRDRQYGRTEWNGKFFTIVDTGGYVVGSEDKFEGEIRKQVQLTLNEADVILFMVDVVAGLHPYDKEFADVVRKAKKPVIMVANKADTHEKGFGSAEFYELGVSDEIYAISSQNGYGTGDLLDRVTTFFPESEPEDPFEGIAKISILGRPNAGKSSLLNLLIGQERSIVTDEAGTTRDAIDTHYKAFGKEMIITDTAGLRRKSRVKDDIEFYSTLRSVKALEKSDVAIIMIDATRGFESQDQTIIGMAHKAGVGILLLVNKWDLVEKETNTAVKMEEAIRQKMAPIDYMPILFTSVTTKKRIFQALEKAVEVYENKVKKIPTSQLNDVLLPIISRNPPPSAEARHINIKYVTQLPGKLPTFAFFCNMPSQIADSYMRFLENKIRENFGFEGVPVRVYFRKK